MSELKDQVEEIFAAVAELREIAGDGPATRKLLDSLFRKVHSVKATASTNGLHDLATVAHELENILHSLRAAEITLDENAIPSEMRSGLTQAEKHAVQQSLQEGASLFLVQTSFDVSDFDQQFQSLKEKLNQSGEVISTAPTDDSGKINFRILYACLGALPEELGEIPEVRIERLAINLGTTAATRNVQLTAKTTELEQAIKRLSPELLTSRIVSVEGLLDYALRAGQAAALATGKQVDFVVRGKDQILAESLCDALSDPVVHLVRNAVAHGIEDGNERHKLGKNPRGTVVIQVKAEHGCTRITVTDDGRGIAAELESSVFKPGFSTESEVSEISGRGVGLDVVETRVKELGGSVRVDSQPGRGSTFEIEL